jgi:hypothetical protein
VPDLDKSGRQNVQHEAVDELDGIESQELLFISVGGIPPAESNLTILHLNQTSVGDRHAMRVASQILEHMLGPAKWSLGIDDPLETSKPVEQSIELARSFQISQRTGQVEFLFAIGAAKFPEELTPEPFAEHFDGQEESPAAGDPTGVVVSNTAGGNQAMQVRM